MGNIESLGLVQLLKLEDEIDVVHRSLFSLNRMAGTSNYYERKAKLSESETLHKARVAHLRRMGADIKLGDSIKELSGKQEPFLLKPPVSH